MHLSKGWNTLQESNSGQNLNDTIRMIHLEILKGKNGLLRITQYHTVKLLEYNKLKKKHVPCC